MGAWNEGSRYISMATILSCLIVSFSFFFFYTCKFSSLYLQVVLSLFWYHHGILTTHFKVTNSIWITKSSYCSLSSLLLFSLTFVCTQYELIQEFHLHVKLRLHILCSEVDQKQLLLQWTEELKIHAHASDVSGEWPSSLSPSAAAWWGMSPNQDGAKPMGQVPHTRARHLCLTGSHGQ